MSVPRAVKPAPLMPRDARTMLPLGAVIAVMGYLAALTLAASQMLSGAAGAWRAGLAGTATIQILPLRGEDQDVRTAKALAIARASSAVASAEPLTRGDTDALLAPWLGGAALPADLALPRLIALDLAKGATPEALEFLAGQLSAALPEARLDTHEQWRDALGRFGFGLAGLAYAVLALIALAAAAAVVFATRAVLMAHHDIVEVLHLVGARDRFIAHEFQRRFLLLALEAGLIGAAAAALTVLLGASLFAVLPSLGQGLYLPAFALDGAGYALLLLVPLAAGLIAMLTARLTVLAALARIA